MVASDRPARQRSLRTPATSTRQRGGGLAGGAGLPLTRPSEPPSEPRYPPPAGGLVVLGVLAPVALAMMPQPARLRPPRRTVRAKRRHDLHTSRLPISPVLGRPPLRVRGLPDVRRPSPRSLKLIDMMPWLPLHWTPLPVLPHGSSLHATIAVSPGAPALPHAAVHPVEERSLASSIAPPPQKGQDLGCKPGPSDPPTLALQTGRGRPLPPPTRAPQAAAGPPAPGAPRRSGRTPG